jgi:hypothetical protein
MQWRGEFHLKFLTEFMEFAVIGQNEIPAPSELVGAMGPALKRPHADTLKSSKHATMKKLRFKADGGVWSPAANPAARKSVFMKR